MSAEANRFEPQPPILETRICPVCKTAHKIHWHIVSVHNRDRLPCPNCGESFVAWSGPVFCTLAGNPLPAQMPHSNG